MEPLKTWNTALPANHGTVSCIVRQGDSYGVLGASHVLCPLWEGVSVGAHPYVSMAFGGGTPMQAKLANWSVPVNSDGVLLSGTRDAALAMLGNVDPAPLLSQMVLPTGVAAPPPAGSAVFFLGATSGVLRRATIASPSTPVNMRFSMYLQYGSTDYRSFYVPLNDTIQVNSPSGTLGGDSGCMLFDAQGHGVGMLIGTFNDYPYFMPLQPALSLFDVEPVYAKAGAANSIMNLIAQPAGASHV